jgi:hypothetical protein
LGCGLSQDCVCEHFKAGVAWLKSYMETEKIDPQFILPDEKGEL